MKILHSIEYCGTTLSLVFEMSPEGADSVLAGQISPASASNMHHTDPWEVLRNIRLSDTAQEKLFQVHGELYRSLVNSLLASLTERVPQLGGGDE